MTDEDEQLDPNINVDDLGNISTFVAHPATNSLKANYSNDQSVPGRIQRMPMSNVDNNLRIVPVDGTEKAHRVGKCKFFNISYCLFLCTTKKKKLS